MGAIGKVLRKAHRPKGATAGHRRTSCSTTSMPSLPSVSGDGEFRFNARQLFYALRPIVMEELGEELKIGNFTEIIDRL